MSESIEIESDFEVILFDPHKTHLYVDEFADLVLREEGMSEKFEVPPRPRSPLTERNCRLNGLSPDYH